MAIIISKGSGLNDDMWKDTGTAVTMWMKDIDKEKTRFDEELESIYKVEESDKWAEKSAGVTAFGDFQPTKEGENAPLDDIQEGYSKLIEHEAFAKKCIITAEMKEDNKVIDMKNRARGFVQSYKRTRAKFGTAALIGGITGSFTFGEQGTTFDATTGDGQALFSTAHPGKKSGVGTQTNKFSNELGSTTQVLYTLANIGYNFRNDSGEKCGYVFDTIYIPSNRPGMRDFLERVIKSEGIVGSANNDVNTQRGKWKLVPLTYWDAADGTNPYILGSSEFQNEFGASIFYDRIPLTVKDRLNIDNFNLEFSGRFRMSCGFRDWRHLIVGGIAGGTNALA